MNVSRAAGKTSNPPSSLPLLHILIVGVAEASIQYHNLAQQILSESNIAGQMRESLCILSTFSFRFMIALNTGINNCSFGDSSSTHLQQYDDSLYADASFATTNEPAVTDSEGYLTPVDSPLYLELQPPKENICDEENKHENVRLNSLPDGDSEATDSHLYVVLEDPNEHNTNSDAGTSSPESDAREESCRGSVGNSIDSPTASTRPSVADSKGPVVKKRRRPPSPPRKGHEVLSSSDKDNKHGSLNTRIDQHGTIEDNELDNDYKANIYESLKEDDRVMSIYEPLDRTNVNI